MALSKRVIETLIDLVEIKLSCIEVYDREDSRELAGLEQCRRELQALVLGQATGGGAVVAFRSESKGRRPATA